MHISTLLSLPHQSDGGPADLTFLAYLDVWLIGGLVLLAVVVVVGKWLWGKLRRPPDDSAWYYDDDEYYPDDDRYTDRC